MLKPYVENGTVTVLTRHEPISADIQGDRVTRVRLHTLPDGDEVTIEPQWILEATELGELYPLAGIEHRFGAEHRDTFGELHGRTDKTDPNDQQAITWCFAMEHRPGEDHVINKPDGYDQWSRYVPETDPAWPGPLFSWVIAGHDYQPRTLNMIPWPDEPEGGQWELWRYRRIVNRNIYASPDHAPPDVSLFNCVQMDYFQKPLLGVDQNDRHQALMEARQQSLCFFYWMQTEAPRHDGNGQGYPGLKLRGNELGTTDGFAMAPYIREPYRLEAHTMLTEAHVGLAQRLEAGVPKIDGPVQCTGELFNDSVGIGHYSIDLHPSTSKRHGLYIPSTPFRIPLGSLIPVRVNNVIASGKALGVSHIANGCTRLHPVEWAIGEAAAVLAKTCLDSALPPQAIHNTPERVREAQNLLARLGAPLSWPWEDG